MSLDVYLQRNHSAELQKWKTRKAESLKEAEGMKGLIPLIEEYYEDRKPEVDSEELFWQNITHNLGKMAAEAGIYQHLWRPEELGILLAKDLIEPLKSGLQKLKDNPEHYKKFNPKNGWGKYENLVEFIEAYLNACIEYPDAEIRTSR